MSTRQKLLHIETQLGDLLDEVLKWCASDVLREPTPAKQRSRFRDFCKRMDEILTNKEILQREMNP